MADNTPEKAPKKSRRRPKFDRHELITEEEMMSNAGMSGWISFLTNISPEKAASHYLHKMQEKNDSLESQMSELATRLTELEAVIMEMQQRSRS